MLQAVPIMLNFEVKRAPKSFHTDFLFLFMLLLFFFPPDQVGKERLLLD